MDRIGGLPGAGTNSKPGSSFFLAGLLKRLGLQETKLFQMNPGQLMQELQSRNLSGYSSRLRTRIEVLLFVLGLDQGQEIHPRRGDSRNRLLSAELLLQASFLAREQGKRKLSEEINDYLAREGFKKEREQLLKSFSSLLREIVDNRAELRILINQLETKGFLGLQKYLRTADVSRLNRISAPRFLALKVFLDYLLAEELPVGRISQEKQWKRIELDLPEIFNQMLLAVNRQRLQPLVSVVEYLVFWGGQELGRAAREEIPELLKDQRFSQAATDLILGRLNRLVFGEKGLVKQNAGELNQQQRMEIAILLSNNYPAIYRYHRQLGLPFLLPEEERDLPRFGPCFIAGAVLTNPEEVKYIEILRFWRAKYLSKNPWGFLLVKIYNKIGPYLARIFHGFPLGSFFLRRLLIKISGYLLLWMTKNNNINEEEDVDVSI